MIIKFATQVHFVILELLLRINVFEQSYLNIDANWTWMHLVQLPTASRIIAMGTNN